MIDIQKLKSFKLDLHIQGFYALGRAEAKLNKKILEEGG